MMFELNDEISYESRAIYTFWDLLGDVGGLFGSLTFLASIELGLIQVFTGSRLNQFITEQLYKIARKKESQEAISETKQVLKSIKRR